jgi:HK97 family phage major capsid protein
MKKLFKSIGALLALSLGNLAHAAGVFANDVVFAGMIKQGFVLFDSDTVLQPLMKKIDKIEEEIGKFSDKADGEIKELGKVSLETKNALEALGIKQKEFADTLLEIQQKQGQQKDNDEKVLTAGDQFVKGAKYEDFVKSGGRGRVSLEVKNTITNAIGNTFSDRKPGIVGGAFRVFTIEDLLTTIPASSNAIDWVQENVFTNNAAERAEGVAKPETNITFAPRSTPVTTVAHWLKISRQLAMDNAALAAYINLRMIYGVNLRVEQQLIAGNGVVPNLSGLTNSGNFTAHGYNAAGLTALGLANNRFDLIGKMIGDCAGADYPADAILVNTADWWTMRLAKDSQGRYILGDPGSSVPPSLFGLPVVASNAMTADTVLVGSLQQAATLHDRESVGVELFEQDENNVQLNLITIRAERRLALTVERPAAIRFGDLTPA